MALANNPRISRMTSRMPHPYTLADAERWIAHIETSRGGRGRRGFGLYLKSHGNNFIGSCGFNPPGEDPLPHLGYWIGEPYWGRGLASEAALAVLAHAFEDCAVAVLQAGTAMDNPASRAILRRLGFRHLGVGTIHSPVRRRDEPIDTFLMTAEDWRERHDKRKVGVP
jgi:RimJ/RimL family protein N-acetyltransferase